jgi:hypothetical protein
MEIIGNRCHEQLRYFPDLFAAFMATTFANVTSGLLKAFFLHPEQQTKIDSPLTSSLSGTPMLPRRL